jgi:hypothetical protein
MTSPRAAARQFSVEGDVGLDAGRPGRLVVAGRCWQGPIHRGTIFTRIATRRPDGAWTASGECSLAVEQILLYGHDVDELDPGLSARLILVGEADRPLAPADLLTCGR